MLLDETTHPPLRARFGELLTYAQCADIAIGTIRLGAIDLTPAETTRVRMRILLGRFEAASLQGNGAGTASQLEHLRRLIADGSVQLRSAGVGWWIPDFSLFRGVRYPAAGAADVCFVGAHYFHTPPSSTGPSFTCMLTDAATIDAVAARFEVLWERGHDVSAVVDETLLRMRMTGG